MKSSFPIKRIVPGTSDVVLIARVFGMQRCLDILITTLQENQPYRALFSAKQSLVFSFARGEMKLMSLIPEFIKKKKKKGSLESWTLGAAN